MELGEGTGERVVSEPWRGEEGLEDKETVGEGWSSEKGLRAHEDKANETGLDGLVGFSTDGEDCNSSSHIVEGIQKQWTLGEKS